jgi:hypothetical protein
MKRTNVEIYALAVCFVCVFAIVANLSHGAYAVTEIFAPRITLKRDFETRATLSNDNYWKWVAPSGDKAQATRPAEEELTRRRLELRAELYEEQSDKGKGNLVSALIYLVGFIVAFCVHWVLARRMRTDASADAA